MASPEVLLTLTFPLSYEKVDFRNQPPTRPMDGHFDARREFEARVDLIRLAVLLARGQRSGAALRVVTEHVHDPLHPNSVSGRFVVTPPATPLETQDLPAIQDWAERIKEHAHPHIALAIRRTLSAADPTRDTDDALVDAVIALEALFGTGDSEVGFRLQTALAFLLTDNEPDRRALHAQVGTLYDARSKLVHGSDPADPMQIQEERSQAVELALECLRLLFSTHQHLIADQGRGKRIILAAGDLGQPES